jgi:hypothetical protein
MTSINLVNLQKYDQLDVVPLDHARVARIAASARQQLADANTAEVSNETRFDCAYNSIRAVADVALLLQGFRTSVGKGGHHQLSIQCLEHTLGVEAATIRMLDALRRQRNGANYDGNSVTAAALAECLKQAHALMTRLDAVLPAA